MIVARIVRVFTTNTPAGGEVEQRLGKVLELPVAPARGQHVVLPDDAEAHAIERVIVHARVTPAPSSWTPGWKQAAVLIDVLLASEPPEGMAAAFASGWQAIAD
jgi:hypothetical protein